jgi:hypothetical protein
MILSSTTPRNDKLSSNTENKWSLQQVGEAGIWKVPWTKGIFKGFNWFANLKAQNGSSEPGTISRGIEMF